VTLDGEAASVAALALDLAGTLRLSLPATSLAAEAYAVGRSAPAPRRLGPPMLPPGLSVDDAFAHVTAHLLDVILHHAGRAVAGHRPEPVHQMRVAMRRLRSAFGLFAGVTSCPEVDAAKAELRIFGAALGPARDWDVFLAGTCAEIQAIFPADRGVARMAAKASRRREAAYAALLGYLGSAEFRRLGLSLALLALRQPWRASVLVAETGPEGEAAPADLAAFAAKALGKRLKRLLAAGTDIAALPVDDLHAIRLNGKRLRYAAEFFAPVFAGRETRRFLRRMTALQERLGHLNDGNVAAGLMAEIGQARGYAGGIVTGFVAAGGAGARGRIARSWKRFRKLEPFWR
jgi:CHAD domain-containing protein